MYLPRGGLHLLCRMEQSGEAVILTFDHKMEIKHKKIGASDSSHHHYDLHNARNTKKLDVMVRSVCFWNIFFVVVSC